MFHVNLCKAFKSYDSPHINTVVSTILIYIYIYCRCETGWSKDGVDIDPTNPNYYTNIYIYIVDVRQDGVRME